MDLQKVNELEAKAGDALAKDQLEDSIRVYSEAIDLARSVLSVKFAGLLSKRAEAHLKQKNHQYAWVDANESLIYNPEQVESLQCRAAASIELGKPQEAVHDFRKILAINPQNADVRAHLRQLSPLVPLSDGFFETFAAHHLQRSLVGSKKGKNGLKMALLQLAFISDKKSKCLRRFLNDCTVSEVQSHEQVSIVLPTWFGVLLVKNEQECDRSVSINISRKVAHQLLQQVKPTSSTLAFLTDKFVTEMMGVYRFSNVIYKEERKLMKEEHAPTAVEAIKKAASLMTRIPYFFELANFEEAKFSKLSCVVIASDFTINFKFLKNWFEWRWPTKHVVFSGFVPNLASFKKFKGHVSESVSKLHIPFASVNCDLSHIGDELGNASQQLQTLKRYFPDLRDVIGTVKFTLPHKEFSLVINDSLKKYVRALTTQINTSLKPVWCPHLKVFVEFIVTDFTESNVEKLKLLESFVADCQHSVEYLKKIRLQGPSTNTFHWDRSCSFAQIEMSTDVADFQIAFK